MLRGKWTEFDAEALSLELSAKIGNSPKLMVNDVTQERSLHKEVNKKRVVKSRHRKREPCASQVGTSTRIGRQSRQQ
jgi:hypothetical protein